ncbi:hypothetical protein [Rhodoferax saidenbachensis]|nr:hypothetical protein [Rhodoferax saidenbachensis]
MPSFLRDVMVSNLVLTDEAIQELNRVVIQRMEAHNSSTQDNARKLSLMYVVRFDDRGYRAFSAEEAWNYYKTANKLERLVFEAECPSGLQTNHMVGEQIQVRLDSAAQSASHIIVGGDSKDWVEATFSALESTLARHKSLATRLARTEWTGLVVQLTGVLIGVLLCLWLATMTAPYLKDVDYPRAVSFALWFLVYGNLWTYLQRLGMAAIANLFPNVRFSREGEHWTQRLIREGVKSLGIAIALSILALLSKWALSVIAPYIL